MNWQALRDWDAFMAVQNLAPTTRRLYRYMLLRFLADEMCELHEVTERSLVRYLGELPAKAGTRNTMLRAVRSYFAWAEDQELVVNPARRLRTAKPKYGPAPYLEETDLCRLIYAAAMRPDPRRAWAILLTYSSAARIASLCEVLPSDVHGDRMSLRITKGDNPYVVTLGPMGQEAVAELTRLIDYRPSRSPGRRPTLIGVGPGRLWQWINDAARDADLKAWPHLLRHTSATYLYEETEDPVLVADHLGHQGLGMVKRYAAITDTKMRAAVSHRH